MNSNYYYHFELVIPHRTRDHTYPGLDTGFLNVPHAQEDKIMKHHVLHVSWQVVAKDFCCFQDETELLNRHCRTSSTENSSNSQFVVTPLHLFYLTWLIFCSSVCHQS